MSNAARAAYRVVALVVSVIVSNAQFQYFDCNEMRTFSFVGGVCTLMLIFGTGETLYRIATGALPTESRLRASMTVLLVGSGVTAMAGFLTMMSHVCP